MKGTVLSILYPVHPSLGRYIKIDTNYYFSAYVCECVIQSVKCKISVIFDTEYTAIYILYIMFVCMCEYIYTYIYIWESPSDNRVTVLLPKRTLSYKNSFVTGTDATRGVHW